MRHILFFFGLTICLATAGHAGPVEDNIVRQLRDQGFDRIVVSRTLLGRSRIRASDDGASREIVVNPVTGEILRDYWIRRGDRPSGLFSSNSGSASNNSGSGSSNSGKGSSNSGSGSSNSGKGSSNSGSGSSNSGKGSSNSGKGSSNSGSGSGHDDDDDDDD
ncbi:MAG: hypothetical protein ACWA5A_02790 [Marinibacterium sp.]